MKKEVIGKCPVCSDNLEVVKLSCSSCGTSVEGSFRLCAFCYLTKEQKEFAEIFIKNRGNIKEIEKDLKVSYPTVKNKLENLIDAMGYKGVIQENGYKRDILKRLYKGEITTDEAVCLLNE